MYYIYEIPGVKVGCTNNIERRMYTNAKKYSVSREDYIILEEHTCIEEATRREEELSREKGYGWDGSPYLHMYNNAKKYRHLAYTKESKKKRIASNTGKKRTKEFKEKLSRAKTGVKIGHVKSKMRAIYLIHPDSTKEYFDGAVLACEKYNLKTVGINHCLNPNMIQKTHKGYRFEYA